MKSRKAACLHAAYLMGTVALLALVPGGVAHGADGTDGAVSTDTLATIDVYADRENAQTVATKLPMTPHELPQSLSVLGAEQVQEQKLVTLDDAMRQTPGVIVEPIDGNRVNFYSRGFEIINLQYDGIPTTMDDRIFAPPDLAVFDKVEVLKGPAGLLAGFGGPGGAINLVRKVPLSTTAGYTNLTVGSWDNYRLEGDFTGPLNEAGTVRGRLVGAFQERDSFQDWTHQKRLLGYGTMGADLTPDTTATVGAYRQENDYKGGWNLPGKVNVVGGKYVLSLLDVPRSTSLGEKWNDDQFTTTGAFANVEHRFGNGWHINLGTQYLDNVLDRVMAYAYAPVIAGQNTTTMYAQKVRYDQSQAGTDISASGPFSLFGQVHEAVIGASYERTEFRARSANGYNPNGSIWSSTVNAYSPVATAAEPVWAPWQRDDSTLTQTYSTYGAVRLRLLDPLRLIAGVRATWWDTAVDTALPTNTPRSTASINGKVTPNAGLVYEVNPAVALYTSVTKVFEPQSYTDASGKVLKPLQGLQYEVGTKVDLFEGRLHSSVALFHVDEENRAQADTRYPNQSIYLAQGKARSQGVELDLTGEVLPGWTVTAGYAYTFAENLDSSVTDSSAFSAIAPKHSFKLWTNYRLPESLDRRWTIGGGATVQSAMSNTFPTLGNAVLTQGGYAVFDARVGFDVTEKVSIAANVKNLFDRTYYQRIGTPQSGNIYGEPRSVLVTLQAKL
ncbi:TonB-dependent siderophore receptor [Nitrospirillum pindoramense]|uniref:Outer membrane receptor for ferric coprogen and ferric-rhodotorulic acid n=1 Tax=Nitrospirillum amazonense TaxID=28077 RepID=A0A560H019_9PROT|nr:TonB-dependent siderophore receptor [Nitrospirillum amazonense]TWB39628.1 outer membrane receptor for ferric coprogen and ferric-rhodotorulic acid [Nitrospirillum amazonense]